MGLRTMKRRRKENKTDYKARLALLKSGKLRIVVRKTNKYFIAQVVESDESKDKALLGVNSKDLIGLGWDKKFEGSLKSVPAGYLTGLLLAKKIKEKKLEGFILDLGMAKLIYGNRIYSVVKGLVDGGVNLNVKENIFPSEERLAGEHLKEEIKVMIKNVREKLK